ncbi:MAG: proline--tRNA ligase [Candidatus Pacebacteria bacterium]|nr:proline--tRNA ligase [Candidatus Paceibacterota bacterium]
MSEAITSRGDNYSQWYLDLASLLADSSPVRGCMVIKPYGYAVWENIQKTLDIIFKETGVENAYFPLFIPKRLMEEEETHAAGFAKEVAVVTHHRLVADDKGHLVPDVALEEPLIVRPTSETIIYATFTKWVQSFRDLPLLINQWCNVVRWELRTRPFLRTTEFLWQEGHTAHATKEEADIRTIQMLKIYQKFVEEYLSIPVIPGRKSESEKFPGADYTTSIEAMMQDGKALQAGTSHMLGQNFAGKPKPGKEEEAKKNEIRIKFLNSDGKEEYVHQTSWGLSTRIIGAIIMTHGDDKGLILPPKIAPIHAVIIPIWGGDADKRNSVLSKADEVAATLRKAGLTVKIDNREGRPGYKFFEWERKGVPIRIELGPKDLANDSVILVRRDTSEKQAAPLKTITQAVQNLLDDIQKNLFERAIAYRNENTHEVDSWKEFTQFIPEVDDSQSDDKNEKPENGKGGFLLAHWCEDSECEAKIKERTKATTRCLPFEQVEEEGVCVLCGRKSKRRWTFAKAY